MKGDRIYMIALRASEKDDADLSYVFSLLEKAKKLKNPKADQIVLKIKLECITLT